MSEPLINESLELRLSPSNRPESATLDITADGRITIADDARPDELRAALSVVAHAFTSLRRVAADLECRPLVLLSKREAHADALVEAQVCDRAEAERRALRRYPGPSRPAASTADLDQADRYRCCAVDPGMQTR